MSQNGGGDSLARGAIRFTFQPAGANVTQEKWDSIWGDDEPEKRSGNADVKPSRNASAKSRKAKKVSS